MHTTDLELAKWITSERELTISPPIRVTVMADKSTITVHGAVTKYSYYMQYLKQMCTSCDPLVVEKQLKAFSSKFFPNGLQEPFRVLINGSYMYTIHVEGHGIVYEWSVGTETTEKGARDIEQLILLNNYE
jgi:hypothetical protein